MKLSLGVTVIVASLLLSACSVGADVSQMTADFSHNTTLKNKNLTGNLQVNQVTGGHETNPLWTSQIDNKNFKEALISSLELANLYGGMERTKYQIDVDLVKISQPLIGFNFTVGLDVNYKITNIKTNHVIFNQNVISSYTVQFADSLDPNDRLKKANEGAARENIKIFIQKIYMLKKD